MTWRERRVREMADLINGFPFDSTDFADDGDLPLVRIRDILGTSFETFLPAEIVPEPVLVSDGDVVIGMDGDFNVVAWSRGPAALNQRLCLLRANGCADMRFLAYALPAHLQVINDLTYATTVKHLSSSQVRGIRMTAPDLPEQRAIADYLDRETSRIDTLIEEQQRLIEMLRELRAALISTETGWGSTRPDEWPMMRLSWLFQATGSGTTPSNEDITYDEDADVPWVTTGELRESVVFGTARGVTSEVVNRYSALKIHPAGSLLIAMYGATIGRMALLGVDAASNQACCALIGPTGAIPEFVQYSLMAAKGWLLLEAAGGGQPNINQDKIRSFRIPVPPLREQRRIAARLNDQTAKIDALVAETERFIELARERRSALITAAVTGQIDVREVA
ncbi:restriction endonuclease subunit S [Nocardioides sp. STR2]|uniref:Restriction endonuclease subunit S n=1 Tax=Nocardioides pini TaxID=2975053 RepID=A0ABT4CE49_9ACTN|nr:restriction endonuclease subunit S [Nocardioides pini]MCY4727237.1 restriction endonuclease subunit S [Nocardioides pini]